MSDDTETTLSQDELTSLKARADMLGIQYHPSIGLEKLRDKVAEALAKAAPDDKAPAPDADKAKAPAEVAAPEPETLGQRRKRLKLESLALVRIRVTCMNPAKKEWEGEIFTVGNSAIGSVTKYVPFNADEGWHVPKIIYEQLLQRQCQVFYTERSKNGINVRKGKLIREFAIELMPSLTKDELEELARRQAASHAID